MHTREEIAEQLSNNIGYGDLLEGTKNGTVVMVNEYVLAKSLLETYEETVGNTTEVRVTNREEEYIVLTQIASVRVTYSKFIRVGLEMKNGEEKYFEVKPDADVNAIIQTLMFQIGRAAGKR